MSLRDVTRTAQDLELTQMNGAKNKLDTKKSRCSETVYLTSVMNIEMFYHKIPEDLN